MSAIENFDQLGAFYLGKEFDVEQQSATDDIVLYDSGDLTTHAVIIGMTGSGKTGLGIGMLEEAALDKIPVIAIDPKGDLGNLMLTFPDLEAESFEPWVNPQTAAAAGKTVAELAADQAELWKNGLAEWGQTAERIRRFKDTVETAIYTPGSSAGIPISVLRTFHCPPQAVRQDSELFNEQVSATTTGVLTLLSIETDPLTSREHILVATILKHAWENGRSIELPELIRLIQDPPVAKVGVMGLDQFYPAKDRFKLAMQLNNLLAAPGFDAWMRGAPLDAQGLFYTETGKPRVSILSIAHLSDSERMFFVTMLLNEVISWMRRQAGTGSLRAVLYMDEILGYLPPTANPPSKALFLTLLKQARAYGLGLVLATQNPVDLDYKALSNAGTWFIGRLQTERDKARIMEGLEGVGAGASFDRQAMERTLAGLGKRRFLLHSVHEDRAVVFNTRWVMSYLAGPFTRDQIQRLMAGVRPTIAEDQEKSSSPRTAVNTIAPDKPTLAPGIREAYLPANDAGQADAQVVYQPRLLGVAQITYHSARHKVATSRDIMVSLEFDDGPLAVDWLRAEPLSASASDLLDTGIDDAAYAPLPQAAGEAGNYTKWHRGFMTWLRTENPLRLYKSPDLKLVSRPGESQGEFRARLQMHAREARDREIKALRQKYDGKLRRLEQRIVKAQQKLDEQASQALQSKVDTALSVGSVILGALMGRKRSTTSQTSGALRKVGRMRKESADATLAEGDLENARQAFQTLNDEFEAELERVSRNTDVQSQELEEIAIRPKSADIKIRFLGLGWVPFERAESA